MPLTQDSIGSDLGGSGVGSGFFPGGKSLPGAGAGILGKGFFGSSGSLVPQLIRLQRIKQLKRSL
tara:strand:+ start:333 stop:527 length:195 start_codon:yes stop_codon:yes gene_type:complete